MLHNYFEKKISNMDAVASLDVVVLQEEDLLNVENLIAEDLSAYGNIGLVQEWPQNEISIEPSFLTFKHSDWNEEDPRLYDRKFWFKMNDVLDSGQPFDRNQSINRDLYHPSLLRSQPLFRASSRRVPNFRPEASGGILKHLLTYGIAPQFPPEVIKAYLQKGLYPFFDAKGISRIGRVVINSQKVPDIFVPATCSNSTPNHVEILKSQTSAIFRRGAQSHNGIQLQLPILSNDEPSTSSSMIYNNLTIPQTFMVVTRTPESTRKVSHDGKKYVKPNKVFKIFKPRTQSQDKMRLPVLTKNKQPVIDIADSESESDSESTSDSESESESEIDVEKTPESSPEALRYSKSSSKRKLSDMSSYSKLEKKYFLRKDSMKLRI